MCLILFAYKTHPDYKLVVIANRDEFYKRPTIQAHWWEQHPDMLAGKDLIGNGSWFGVNRKGRFAALTNYRDGFELKKDAITRGTLVTDYLTKDVDTAHYISELQASREAYNGYNALFYDNEKIYHYSNMEEGYTELQPGIYGLSNHLLDTSWPKVEKGKEGLKNLLKREKFNSEKAFNILQNYNIAIDEELPTTNIPIKWERVLSAMFIKTEEYGTRCSTVLVIDNDNNVTFEERTYIPSVTRSKFEYQSN